MPSDPLVLQQVPGQVPEATRLERSRRPAEVAPVTSRPASARQLRGSRRPAPQGGVDDRGQGVFPGHPLGDRSDQAGGLVLREAAASEVAGRGGEPALAADIRPAGLSCGIRFRRGPSGAGPGFAGPAVGGAVGMEEAEAGGPGAVDQLIAAVDGAVVGLAEQERARRVVLSAVGAAMGVVLMEKPRVSAPPDGAAAVVASDDLAAEGRGDGLGSPAAAPSHVGEGSVFGSASASWGGRRGRRGRRRLPHVGRRLLMVEALVERDDLGVAADQLGHGGVDGNELATAFGPGPGAGRAFVDGELISRPPGVGVAIEDGPGEELHKLVVGDVTPGIAGQRGLGFPKQRQGLALNLEECLGHPDPLRGPLRIRMRH